MKYSKLILPILAAAAGVSLALWIPEAKAEDCASVEGFLVESEKLQDKYGGQPYWFDATETDGVYVVQVYYAGDPHGFSFRWSEGQCKAVGHRVPAFLIKVRMGEENWEVLAKEWAVWKKSQSNPKPTKI